MLTQLYIRAESKRELREDLQAMNREKIIQEQRTIEAMKKGYMGLEGKFATIVKKLGYPVIKQGGLNFDQTFLEDYYNLEDDDALPTMDEEEGSYEIGWAFDGLNRGMNLSILVLFHNREITVRYDGQLVYSELAGDLEGFAPEDGWEQKIDNLFSLCKKVERQDRPAERKRLKDAADRKRKEILENLRTKWGV